MTQRVAVYTAIFGDYDELKEQPSVPGVDYICFTDDRERHSAQWRVVRRQPRFEHPRLSAKWFKMFPQLALPTYRYTIWVDGHIQILSEAFVEELLAFVNQSGFALFRHPERDNLVDEVEASERLVKYQGLPVREQAESYLRRGFDGRQLYACGVLVRDSWKWRLWTLSRAWMRENRRWTYQDQVSLPFLVWKKRIRPGLIPYNIRENHLLAVRGSHKLKP